MQQALEAIPIFAGISEEGLKLLLVNAREEPCRPGQVIFREGEASNRFYLIERGAVEVVKASASPEEIKLATLRAGEFFGEMCILETLPRSATIRACEEGVLHSLTSIAFYRLYEEAPRDYSVLLLNIARDLSRRLRHLDEVFAARH